MPLYEYLCKSCGHHTEMAQSFTDAPLTTCPVCGGELRKLFSSPGILFKGSGFYRTDSRLPAKSKSDKGEKGEAGTEAGKGDAQGDGQGDKADKSAAATTEPKADGKPSSKSSPKPPSRSSPAPAKTGDVAKTA